MQNKKRLIVATGNRGKLAEFADMLDMFEVVSYKDVGIDAEIEENGKTFLENAIIKAQSVAKHTSFDVLADDSGLCVNALSGAPGIYTARFAGENATDDENIDKLLQVMEGQTDRRAEFRCCLALVRADGTVITGEGATTGEILSERRGSNGFGYNPVFYSYDLKKSFGQADEDEKNLISHRGRALKDLLNKLK